MGQAISYARNRGDTLTRFLDDVRIPLDNNASERALRIVALGRRNFLFVSAIRAAVTTSLACTR
jgi:transposase